GGDVSSSPPVQPRQDAAAVAAISDDPAAQMRNDAHSFNKNGNVDVPRSKVDVPRSKNDDSGAYAPSAPRNASQNEPQLDEKTLAGPTPAFQVSLLEMESDLRTVIAQVEAKRAHTHDGDNAAQPHSREDVTSQAQMPRADKDQHSLAAPTSAPNTTEMASPVEAPKSAAPNNIQDREAAYFGSAAQLETPYDTKQ
ncbi:hypothetical protein, partial [Pacificibacter sp.]|uniref:hypothetical protein n=1 Tax=Pacificibacter sp. TaxID=1917866 RepID=UPI0032191EB1